MTLYYKDRRWQHRDWTFPDYRRADYQQFFTECRDYLRQRASARSEPRHDLARRRRPRAQLCRSPGLLAFVLRRLAPRWGLVDRAGERKVHSTARRSAADWRSGSASSAACARASWSLDCWADIGPDSADRLGLSDARSLASSGSTTSSSRISPGSGQQVGRSVDLAGGRHGADAAGTGRRRRGARLAAAAGGASCWCAAAVVFGQGWRLTLFIDGRW